MLIMYPNNYLSCFYEKPVKLMQFTSKGAGLSPGHQTHARVALSLWGAGRPHHRERGCRSVGSDALTEHPARALPNMSAGLDLLHKSSSARDN